MSTAPICHSVILLRQLVLPLIMCAKDASFLCPSAGYVHSSLTCPQLPWVRKYFGVGGADSRARPQPLLALRQRPRP